MADEQVQDKYAFIIDDCRCSSSQEELLSHCKFAREDEIFYDDEVSLSSAVVDSRSKLDAGGEVESKHGGELVDGEASNAVDENLGFQGERKRMKCEEEIEVDSQLKKTRVTPMVHCSGKIAIEVEIGSSLAGVVPGDSGCTEKLESEGFEDDVMQDNGVMMKKKVDFVTDTEVINLEDGKELEGGRSRQKGNGDKEEGEARGEGSGKVEDEEEEDVYATRRGKRQLPPSMFGVYWCDGSEDENGNVNGNGDLEGGLEEISGDGNGNGNSNGDLEEGLKEISGDGNGNGNKNGDLEGDLKEISGDGNGNGNINGDLEGDLKEISGDGNGNRNINGDLEEGLKETSGDGNGDGNRNGDLEGGLKEISGDGNGNGNRNGDLEGDLKEISRDGNENRNRNRGLEGDLKEISGDGNENGNRNGDLEGDLKDISGDGNENRNRNGDLEADLKEINGDGNGIGDKNGDLEGGTNEISEDEKRNRELKGSEDDVFKCTLGVLREEYSDDNIEVDIYETSKRLGMIFPRSRFLPEVEED